MSTEGSVSIGINITEDFASVESKATKLTTAIAALDTAIGTNKSRTISIAALLDSTKFDETLKAKVEQVRVIKIQVDPEVLSRSVAAAFTANETPHVIKTTVDLANVNSIIKTSFDAEHPINVTVNPTGLETKVQAAIKNKSYPVELTFTSDSAVTSTLSAIEASMSSLANITKELQQITTNALSGLESQMQTYFNNLNHIMDLTNKVAATVETNELKKAEAVDKAAKRMEDAAQKLADKTAALDAKLAEKKATAAQKAADDAAALAEKTKSDALAKAQQLADKEQEIAAKAAAAILKDKQDSFAKYIVGTEVIVSQRIGIEEKQVRAMRAINQRMVDDFKASVRERLDTLKTVLVGYKEEETAALALIDVQNKLAEAKRKATLESIKSANLNSATYENTGTTGAKVRTSYEDFSISKALGGTGKSQNDLKKEAEVEAIAHKERVDAWKNFLEQVGVITHEANVAHEKEFMRNHSYEEYITKAHTQALAEEANRNNKLHEEALKINEKITTDYQNKQIKAFEESVFMNKKHTEALIEDAARYNKLHEEALKINEKIDKDYHNSVIKAHEDDIYMSKKHTDALIEDQHRYNMMHEEALRMNLKITTDYQNMQIKAFEDEQYMMRKHMQALAEDAARGHDATNTRGAKLNSGQALAISPADIAALREYRAEIERTHGPVSRLQNSFYSLNNTLMQLGIYMSGRQLLEYADQWIHFTSMVRIASNDYINAINERLEGEAKISESQKKLFAQRQIDEVFKISQDTRMGIHDTAMLFMRMSRAAEAMGIDFDKAKLLTEQLGKSMMVMGLSPAMARGALLQLEQALGGVVVRGQEFKSVNDGLPIIMRTIAKHYNEQKAAIDAVSLGMAKGSKEFDEYIQKNKGHALSLKELRDLMLKGEMYSSISAAALLSKEAIAEIDEQTAHMHTTFAQAFTLIENGFIKYIGELNESSGASEVFYGWAKKLSESFDVFGSVIAGLVVPIGTAMLAMGALEMATKAVNLAMAANIYLKIIGAVVLLTTSLSGLAATHGDLVSGMTGNWEQFMKMWENPEDNSFIKTLKEAIKLLSELFTLSEQNPLSAIGKGLARVAEDLGIAMSVLGQNVFGTSNDPNDYSKDSTVGKINLARIKAQEDNLNKELRDSEYLDKIIDLDKLTRDEKLRLIAVGKERFAAEQALVQIAKMQAERTREAAMTPEQKSVEDEIDRAMKLRDQVLNKGKSEGEKINSRELAETKIPTGGDERKLAMGRLGFYENGIESAMTQTVKGAQWEEAVRAYKQVKEEAEKTAAAKKLEKDLEKDAASAKTKEEKALRDRQAIEKDILSMHDSREAMEVRQLNLMERQVNYAKMSTEELRNQLSLSAEKLQKIELKPFEITINTDVAEGKLMQLGEKFNGTIPASVQKLQPLIDAAVAKYPTVSADVIRAIIMHESMGENIGTKILDKYGKPASTAFGVGQFTNPTAKTLGIDNHNVEQSVMGIAKYLTILGKAFDNNLPKMLAGYAAGEGGARAGGGKVSAAEVLALIPKVNNEDIQKMIDRNLANSVGAQQVSTQAVAGLNVPQGQAVQTGNHATDLANAKAYNDAYVKAVREADEYQMQHGKEFTKEYADSFTTMYKSLVKGQNTASANLQQRLAEDTKAYDELLKRILEARDLEDRPMVAGEKSRVKNEVGDLVRAKGWDAVPELQGRAQAKSGELMQTESALAHFKGTNMSGMNAEQKSTYEGIIGTLTTKQKMLKNEIALTSDEAERLNGEKLDKYTNELNKAESAIKNMKLDKVDYSPFLTSMKELTTSMQGMFGETFDRISTGFSSAMSVGLESMSKLDEMNVASKEKEIANQKEIAAISDPKLKEEALARHNKEKTAMESTYVQTVVGGTAKMAGAASKMFSENSAGRKALHAIEVGLHGVELAMSFAKTAASMAAGAAKFFEQSGWAGFAGVAAMVAVMAGFGIMAGGGSGGAKDSSTPDTKTTGSVLGDSDVASSSVKNIVETLNNIHYSEYAALLDIAANFKNMSKAIDGSIIMAVQQHGTFSGSTKGMSGASVSPLGSPAKAIGGVVASTAIGGAGVGAAVLGAGANALIGAGATTIGGMVGGVATSMTGAAISTGMTLGASATMSTLVGGMALGLAGGLVLMALQYGLGKLLGIGKVKYEAIGYGIVTKATEMIIDGSDKAMVVYDYTKVKQTIKGWFSDTVKIYDVVNGINQELTGSVSTVFSTFKNVLKDTAKTLDITQYMDTAFTVPKIKLSFTKLKSEDIAKKITDALNTTMDNITSIVTNGLITPFQKMGEGALEAFVRIGAETVIVNETFKRAGYNLGSSGMGLVQISQSLLDLYESSDKANDGLKNFISSFDSLIKTISTAGEKLQMNLAEMQNRLNLINTKGQVLSEGTKPVTFNQDFSKTLGAATVDYITPLKTAMEATSVDFRKNLTSKFNTVIDETTGKSRKMTTDEKKTRAEDIFGKDYAATMGARDYTLNRNEISTLTLGQLKGSIEGTVTSAFKYLTDTATKTLNVGKTSAVTAAYEESKSADVTRLAQDTAIESLLKVVNTPTAENLAPYVTGGIDKTKIMSNEQLISAASIVATSLTNKAYSPENTLKLAQAVPKLNTYDLGTDPLQLTGVKIQKALDVSAGNLASLNEVSKVIKDVLQTLPTTDISTFNTTDKKQYKSWVTEGGVAKQMVAGTATKDNAFDFATLTSDKLIDSFKKNLFGPTMDSTQKGAYQTNGKDSAPFYTQMAEMIRSNDAAVVKLSEMKLDPTKWVGDNFKSISEDNKKIMIDAVTTITSMNNKAEQIKAVKDLDATYTSLISATGAYSKALTDAEPYVKATLQGIINIKSIAESALSKITTASETKTRVNATSLIDMNYTDDITGVINDLGLAGKLLIENTEKWLATKTSEEKAYYGITEEIKLTERALKAYDNELVNNATALNNAKTALTNFQKSISDWVQGMKTTQVGNTKTQMDAASRQFDSLLLRIQTPTSAEDKNLALTKITGAADAYLGAVKNYYGTSKAGADITANVIGMMDTLPDSLTVQELMLGELQKIKENTAAMPKFEGMSQASTDTIDTLSKAIAAAMAIDKTNPTLANSAELDAKANVMLILSKAVTGATAEDEAFLNNLVSAIGGGQGLSATIDATIDAKLGATKTEDILGTLKTSFAALELEIEKVKLNPTQENIDKMQDDINTFKTLTANINGAVTALGLDPENPNLIKDVQDSLDAMTTFTASIANVTLTKDATKTIEGDFDKIKKYFETTPVYIFPSVDGTAKQVAFDDLKNTFNKTSTTISDFIIDKEQQKLAKDTLNAAFNAVVATINSVADETSKSKAFNIINDSVKSINAWILSNVDPVTQGRAYATLTAGYSAITATINSKADPKAKQDTFDLLQLAYSNIDGWVKAKLEPNTAAATLSTATAYFNAISANVTSNLEPKSFALVQATLKASFSSINDIVYMDIDDKSKADTILEIGKAYAGLTATVTVASKLGDAGKGAVDSLTAALKVVTATIDNVKLNPTPTNLQDLNKSIAAYGPLHANVSTAVTELDTNLDPTKTQQLKTNLQKAITALGTFTTLTDLKLAESQTAFLKTLNDFFGLKENRATVFANMNTTEAIATLNALKNSYSTLTQTVSVLPAGDLATKAKGFVDTAFATIVGTVNAANLSDTAKTGIINGLNTTFSTYNAFITNASVTQGAKEQASSSLTTAVSAITATVASTKLGPDIQKTTNDALNLALSSMLVLIKDVGLNPTAANQNTLLTQLKAMDVAIDDVSASVTKLDLGTAAEKTALTTKLQTDVTALTGLSAKVGLGLKDTAKTELDTAVSKITPSNVTLTIKFTSWDAISKAVVDNIVTVKEIGDKGIVFDIRLPDIGLTPIQNLMTEVVKTTNEVIKMISGFDSMLTKAADVQKAISLFATGNKVIEAYTPLKGEIRNKTGYTGIDAISGMALGNYLDTVATAKSAGYKKTGQYDVKSEAAALNYGVKMYDVFNDPASKYNKSVSYVMGYNSTHDNQIEMEVGLVSDAMLNQDSFNLGAKVRGYKMTGTQKAIDDAKLNAEKADLKDANTYYKTATDQAKAQAQNYFTLMGFNASSASPYKFADGGTFTNGIVTRPTSFDMGLMGEAGPEAIMPLVQTSGGLGVRAVAANDNNKDSEVELAEMRKQNQILMAQNAILQEGFKQLISVNAKQADSLDNIESNNRRAAA